MPDVLRLFASILKVKIAEKSKKWLFQNTFVFPSYCALAETEFVAYVPLCQLYSKAHVASSTCHSTLFEVFREMCVCVSSVRQGKRMKAQERFAVAGLEWNDEW